MMRSSFFPRWMAWAAAAAVGLAGGPFLRADEALRHVQQALRDQGFYYGTIDGAPGDETTQAIRRYQIRNGLAVSGQLDDATRRAIDQSEATAGKSASKVSSPSAHDTRPSAAEDATPPPLNAPAGAPAFRSVPRPLPASDDAVPARPPVPPPDSRGALSAGPEPSRPAGGVAPSAALTALFERTPYEFAPPPVQTEVVRRAQAALLRDGFYDGAADGVFGRATAEALSNLQEVSHIRATGRLDTQTLALLHLLPTAPRRLNRPPLGPGGVYGGRLAP